MNVSQYFLRVATKSKSVSSALEDYELLAALLSGFSQGINKTSYRDEIFSPVDTGPNDLRALCTVSERCGGVWTVREGVDWLIFYIFYRRYGWDECPAQQLGFQVYMPSVAHRLRSSTRDDEMRYKERIVTISSDLISWLEQHSLLLSVIKMYNSAIRIARSTNVTRQHLILHTLRWVATSLEAASGGPNVSSPSSHRRSIYGPARGMSVTLGAQSNSPFLPPDATPESMYMAVQELIILSTTDSVCSIRNAVIPMLGRLLQKLSLNTCLRLLDSFIEMFNRQEVNAWETADGYLIAMGLLIKRTVAIGSDEENVSNGNQPLGPPPPTMITSESFQKDRWPRIKMLLFNLFDHPHASVRINAVRLYITCLRRCPHAVIQTALDEIMNEVCVLPGSSGQGTDTDLSPSLGSNAIESLLSLCQILLRHLFSLTNRSGGLSLPPSTGELQNSLVQTYLSHPDVSVRSAACQVYETLIYSALGNPNRVRYLLSKVMENWAIKQDVLLAPLHKVPLASGKSGGSIMVTAGTGTDWHEGRLRVYGEVCRMFVQKHLTAVCDALIRASDSDSGLSLPDDVFVESPRPHGNKNNSLTRKIHAAPKRSVLYELGHAAEIRAVLNQMDDGYASRRNSVFQNPPESNTSQPSSSLRRLSLVIPFARPPEQFRSLMSPRLHLPLLSKKHSTGTNSILDRLRAMDDNEKSKPADPARASVWRNEIAKRLSVSPNKSTSKSSVTSLSEGEPTRMRVMFANLLHASIECLVMEPRELRQCARQAFSEIGRLMRWFDANLFMEFLAMHLTHPPTLMSYACLKMLRSSLEEFIHYERRFLSSDEQNLNETLAQMTLDAQRKTGSTSDCVLDAHFLNCPQIRVLFSAERSALWLYCCQQYLTEESTPTFVCLPALDCVMKSLSLASQLSQFSHAVQWTENTQQSSSCLGSGLFGDRGTTCNLVIDSSALLAAVQTAVNYVHRFEIILDERNQPSSITGEHQRLGSLRPFYQRRSKSAVNPGGCRPPLATFLVHIVANMEPVLFYYLPPTPNPVRPDLATRYAAGQLLSPMLLTLVTWPLAILRPTSTESSTVYPDKYESRVLAVRRLLRLIAAIVHAMPLVTDQTTVGGSSSKQKNDAGNSLLSLIERNRNEWTEVINAYFAQMEKILYQLREACSPTQVCRSTSWWWFRAMCEHLPRLMQVAPHANPISLIRTLLDEARRANDRGAASGYNKSETRNVKLTSSLACMRWKRAFNYAKGIAVARIQARQPQNLFAYRWPTVSVLKEVKSNLESGSNEPTSRESPAPSPSTNRLYSGSQLGEDDEATLDGQLDGDSKQSAFDQMTDDEPDFIIEPAEADTSSGEEQMVEFDCEPRRHRSNVVSRSSRLHSNRHIKAQAIETPPPYADVLGLIRRICNFCHPVTTGTLRTFMSPNEIQLITGEVDPTRRQHRGSVFRT